jgi:GH24 family phage-related lysozyme (muramidase)
MGITSSFLLGGLTALACIAAMCWAPLPRRLRQRGQSTPRIIVAALSLSAAGLVGLVVHEGYTDRAVVPTQGDRPTVGFGSTFHEDGTPVQLGDTTTPVRALIKAHAHITKDEAAFRASLPGVALHQGEYDVYLDWTYQYGTAAWAKSGMRRELLAGDYTAACNALLAYRFAGGFDCSTPGNKRCAGVWTRQLERHAKCMELQQ